ncbi:LOW QUALITY PROTEIN: rootletin [Amborella trichopoda]|nr:LOW QUALITY PROTEIN: rootletin [Amborella trichopoda]|eukprot:XP_020523673.1 LOW QUALITY PROTEIN: rootletin [Amborella trichopoda]
MERNKNRKDLLAAGRKKLEQFKKKRESKGGKSFDKNSRPEQEIASVDKENMEVASSASPIQNDEEIEFSLSHALKHEEREISLAAPMDEERERSSLAMLKDEEGENYLMALHKNEERESSSMPSQKDGGREKTSFSENKDEERAIASLSKDEERDRFSWRLQKVEEGEIASLLPKEDEEREISSLHAKKDEERENSSSSRKAEEREIASSSSGKDEEKEIASLTSEKDEERETSSFPSKEMDEERDISSLPVEEEQDRNISSLSLEKEEERDSTSLPVDTEEKRAIPSLPEQKDAEREFSLSVEQDSLDVQVTHVHDDNDTKPSVIQPNKHSLSNDLKSLEPVDQEGDGSGLDNHEKRCGNQMVPFSVIDGMNSQSSSFEKGKATSYERTDPLLDNIKASIDSPLDERRSTADERKVSSNLFREMNGAECSHQELYETPTLPEQSKAEAVNSSDQNEKGSIADDGEVSLSLFHEMGDWKSSYEESKNLTLPQQAEDETVNEFALNERGLRADDGEVSKTSFHEMGDAKLFYQESYETSTLSQESKTEAVNNITKNEKRESADDREVSSSLLQETCVLQSSLQGSSETPTLPQEIEAVRHDKIETFELLPMETGFSPRNEEFDEEVSRQPNLVERVVVDRDVHSGNGLELLEQLLYQTSVTKECFHMQLIELIQMLMESDKREQLMADEISSLNDLVNETRESNDRMAQRRVQCNSELIAMTAEKEKLEIECLAAKGQIEQLGNLASDLQHRLEQMEKKMHLTGELSNSKEAMAVLQAENANLVEHNQLVREELDRGKNDALTRQKLEEDHDFLLIENSRLLTELHGRTEDLLKAYDMQVKLEDDLKEAMGHLEQLTVDNVYFSFCLGIHKAKLRETNDHYWQSQTKASETSSQPLGFMVDNRGHMESMETSMLKSIGDSESGQMQQEGGEDPDHGDDLLLMKEHLHVMGKMMANLEKAIHGLQAESVSSGKTDEKVSSGVSKLIQAFESKTHHDDEDDVLTESNISKDSFEKVGKRGVMIPASDANFGVDWLKVANEEANSLKAALNQLDSDMKKAHKLLKQEEESNKLASVALREVEVEYDLQKKQKESLATNMAALAKRNEEHVGELVEHQARLEDLHSQLNQIQGNAAETARKLTDQIEWLQREVNEKSAIVEQERDSCKAVIFEAIAPLKDIQSAYSGHTYLDNSDVFRCLFDTVTAAVNSIDDLHERLLESRVESEIWHGLYEELRKECFALHEKNQLGLHMLDKVHTSMRKLVFSPLGTHEETEMGLNSEAVVAVLSSRFEFLVEQLQSLLDERVHLLYTKSNLEMELSDKIQIIEDLNEKNLRKLGENEIHGKNEKVDKSVAVMSSDVVLQEGSTELQQSQPDVESEAIISKSIEAIECAIQAEASQLLVVVNKQSVSHLETLVLLLIEKYRETTRQLSLLEEYLCEFTSRPKLPQQDKKMPLDTMLREEFQKKVFELSELMEKIHELSSWKAQHEDDTRALKESLQKMKDDLKQALLEKRNKETELEHSEQRLVSVREKLSLAVGKGKALIVQRDGLRQSLAEMSNELEKCCQELQSKTMAFQEVEAKLNSFGEAGERVEALESELSYIRHSATALRESFLQKDSILQRIEEILEDLDLPEQFHSGDIIDKVGWLVRSIGGNPLPAATWENKILAEGSYSDAGFVVPETWKEDRILNSNADYEDLKRNYEDLQSKFYSLAEQTDMLEQSLVERNSLLQRWEEVLDRVEMPLPLRSIEPEDRIEWLGRALSEAQYDRASLQEKYENLESNWGSVLAEIDTLRNNLSILEAAHAAIIHEKEIISESLAKLSLEHREVLDRNAQDKQENEKYKKQIGDLQEQILDQNVGTENEIKRFLSVVNDALPSHDVPDLSFNNSVDCLEASLVKLIDNYHALSVEISVLKDSKKEQGSVEVAETVQDRGIDEAPDVDDHDKMTLKAGLEEALSTLVLVKEERDQALEKCERLIEETIVLGKERDDLREQLTQEEQKSASAREKLSVAVRKGKGLVQQRDSMRQTIDETNAEVERLRSELHIQEKTIKEYEVKTNRLSSYLEKCEVLESENVLLRNRLEEADNSLEDTHKTFSGILTSIHAIDVPGETNFADPLKKIEWMGKLIPDLQSRIASSEQEVKKYKRAADLLVEELNAVQERADNLQEELSRAETELMVLSKQKDASEAAKAKAMAQLEESAIEQNSQQRKLVELKDGMDLLKEECCALSHMLSHDTRKNLELLGNVEAGLKSLLNMLEASSLIDVPSTDAEVFSSIFQEEKYPSATNLLKPERNYEDQDDLLSPVTHGLQTCVKAINVFKGRFHGHSAAFDQKTNRLLNIMEAARDEVALCRRNMVSLKQDIASFELIKKEKDSEINTLHQHLSFLYNACYSSVLEMQNQNTRMLSTALSSSLNALETSTDRKTFKFSEESVKMMVETLLLAVKECTNMQAEMVEGTQKEFKAAISHLQREVQERDIQKNKICAELVNQIKEAEADGKNYLQELDSVKAQLHACEKQVKLLEDERNMYVLRVNELENSVTSSKELQDQLVSLTDNLSAKEQEIEGLLQALDEEETQMEAIASRVQELERIIQQKDRFLENLEASRVKAVAKLATTVSKFDELHELSEHLLDEVENLQSQLQGRDEEISFLRQEVTRCTNDLLGSEERAKMSSTEVNELFTWLETMVLWFVAPGSKPDDNGGNKIGVHMQFLEKQIASVLSELEDLRVKSKSGEAAVQDERGRVEELLKKVQFLENSMNEKESQLRILQVTRDPGQSAVPEYLDAESMGHRGKRPVPLGPVTPHVRSGRKATNDYIALTMDTEDSGNTVLEDEDDDKAHGFKSLTTSKIVPRFTRPIADKIDGIWVSGERALMRQPTLRLATVFYWIAVHLLLANTII